MNFKSFMGDMLLNMCILSGCDYIDSLKGIGLKTAHKHMVQQGNDNVKEILIKMKTENKKLEIP
jgi:5'-3' exonuclease